MPTPISAWRQSSYSFICNWLLPFGFVVLLAGLAVLPERSLYHKLFYALIAAPALLAIVINPRPSKAFWVNPVTVCYLIFAGWALLTISWADTATPPSSLFKRPIYILLMLLAAALVAINSSQRLIAATLVAGGALLTATAPSLFEFAQTAPPDYRFIGSGLFNNPLLSSHVFGFFFSLSLAICMTQKKPFALLATLASIILGLALVATGSRTPILASCLTCIWLVITCCNRRSIYLLFAVAVSGAVLLFSIPELLSTRGFSYRPELWIHTLHSVAKHLWLGAGFGSNLSIYIEALNTSFSEPHSFALGVLYYTGAIGLILWTLMHAAALWQCWRNRSDYLFIICGALLVYGLGAGLTEGGGLLPRPKEHWFVTWIPLAFIIALSVSRKLKQPLINIAKLSQQQLLKMSQDATVLEQDGLGPKVLKLTDGSFLKLFRKRSPLSNETLMPYALRFAKNSQRLNQLGFISPSILQVAYLDDPVNGTAVQYLPLPGQTLRQALSSSGVPEREQLVERFGELLAKLHNRGVYFRSAHLGNILQLPDGSFGLIDISDMQITGRSLSFGKRKRNLKHIQRYAQDRQWLFEEHLCALQRGYALISAKTAKRLFRT